MKTMTLALAAATVLSLNAARPDDARKDPHDTDPRDRVMLVHSVPANADYATNPGDRFRGLTASAGMSI
jgi:hypothetical protein